jgi:NTP pyrophosphatase (non-canonical NTP hydrolase)
LMQALSKYKRAYNKSDDVKLKKYENICEEIADVELTINQLKYIFGIDNVDKYKEKKLLKINKRLDKYNGKI